MGKKKTRSSKPHEKPKLKAVSKKQEESKQHELGETQDESGQKGKRRDIVGGRS